MAHCPYDQLADIPAVLAVLRALPGLVEKKPGIFYWRSKSFAHFHLKAGRRWADIRDGADWGTELDLPFDADQKQQEVFCTELKARWARTTLKSLKP